MPPSESTTNLLTTHTHCSCSWLSKSPNESCQSLKCPCSKPSRPAWPFSKLKLGSRSKSNIQPTPMASCCTKLPTIVLNPHYRKGVAPSLSTVDCHAGTRWQASDQPNWKGVDEWVTTGRFTPEEVEAFNQQFKKNPRDALGTAAKGLASRLSDSLLRSRDPTLWKMAIIRDGDIFKDEIPVYQLMRGWGMDVHTFKGTERVGTTDQDDESIVSKIEKMTLYDSDEEPLLCPSHQSFEEFKKEEQGGASKIFDPARKDKDGKTKGDFWLFSMGKGADETD